MKKKLLTLVYQSEAAECGLACLCMVSNWYGIEVDMWQLRQKAGLTSRGMTLKSLLVNADSVGLRGIPMKGEPEIISKLIKPCIIHWNFDHFVVFNRYRHGKFEIYDPAIGIRNITPSEFSRSFTGIFVDFELIPNAISLEKRSLPKIVSYLTQTRGIFKSLGVILLVAITLEICSLFAPLYLRFAIDQVLSKNHLELLTRVAIGFVILLTAQSILGLVRSILILLLTQHISLQWPVNIFAHMMKLPMEFFYRHPLGDITSRFGSLAAIQQKITVGAVEAFIDGLMAIASICVMVSYAPWLTCLPLAAFILQTTVRYAAYKRLEELSRDRLVASARENSYFLESIRAILPLKLFSRETERRVAWQSHMTTVQQLDIEKGRLDAFVNSITLYITSLENIIVIYFGMSLVFAEENSSSFSLGMLIVFLTYKQQFISRITGISKSFMEFRMVTIHTDRLAEIIMTEVEPFCEEKDLSLLSATIELKNIYFRYEVNGPWILENISCKFNQGERIAITGRSGEGKTTLLKMLLGLLVPTQGKILYGGVEIAQLGLGNVRRIIGTVMQEDALLVGSVEQNISFFDQNSDSNYVEACAVMANIHHEILGMPMGYLTKIGDLGDGLSGGQKQRLLLARAIYKKPKFLILDEATSHLDTGNESVVNAAISHLAMTRVIVAHRPSTIAGSDRVFELSMGKISEISEIGKLN